MSFIVRALPSLLCARSAFMNGSFPIAEISGVEAPPRASKSSVSKPPAPYNGAVRCRFSIGA